MQEDAEMLIIFRNGMIFLFIFSVFLQQPDIPSVELLPVKC